MYPNKEKLIQIEIWAKQIGYGHIIAFLKRSWAEELKEKYELKDTDAVKTTYVTAYNNEIYKKFKL